MRRRKRCVRDDDGKENGIEKEIWKRSRRRRERHNVRKCYKLVREMEGEEKGRGKKREENQGGRWKRGKSSRRTWREGQEEREQEMRIK